MIESIISVKSTWFLIFCIFDIYIVESGLRILFNVGDDLEAFDRSLCS